MSGLANVQFCAWAFFIFCLSVANCLLCRCLFTLVHNDLRYEKEAEKRATMYRPKTRLKRERKLQFCWCSAFFYDRLLQTGLCLSYSNVRILSIWQWTYLVFNCYHDGSKLSRCDGERWGWQALLLPLVVCGLVWVVNVPDCEGLEALACEVDAVTFFRNIN